MNRPPRVVIVGDVILDRDVSGSATRLSPDAPVPVVDVEMTAERAGGAGLAARLCAADDAVVTLIAPIADDSPGRRLTELLSAGLTLVPLPHGGPTRCKTRVLTNGQVVVRLDDGGPGTPVQPPHDTVRRHLHSADLVLVSDYGAGTTRDAGLRRLCAEAATRVPLVWDPHPRGGPPVSGAFVTPNLAEACTAAAKAGLAADGAASGTADELARALCEHWRARAVCVTAGADGAYLAVPGEAPIFLPAPLVAAGDTCGAGDRFVTAAAARLARGDLVPAAFAAGVATASAWVAAGGVRSVGCADPVAGLSQVTGWAESNGASAGAVAAAVRSRGGTVVATGGCFDMLHAGHVASLQAARRLGDTLIVLINSDESARRLKGPGRPVVGAADRAQVLRALGCVDAVEVFEEDDPGAALDRIRPDIWVKGGDYSGVPLPETELVESWGGRVVLVPYLDGRSTTAILHRSAHGWAPNFQEAS